MRPIDSTAEIGPAVDINLTGETLRRGLLLHLPVRGVISFGRRSPEYVGWQFEPHLMYRADWFQWDWTLRGGPAFGSGGYHRYYYRDRKSTRLNSSHVAISYAVFCLKKK